MYGTLFSMYESPMFSNSKWPSYPSTHPANASRSLALRGTVSGELESGSLRGHSQRGVHVEEELPTQVVRRELAKVHFVKAAGGLREHGEEEVEGWNSHNSVRVPQMVQSHGQRDTQDPSHDQIVRTWTLRGFLLESLNAIMISSTSREGLPASGEKERDVPCLRAVPPWSSTLSCWARRA